MKSSILLCVLFASTMTNSSFTGDQKEFGRLLNYTESIEILYNKCVSGCTFFTNSSRNTFDWYKKYDDLYWDSDKNCLYTLLENHPFAVHEYLCINKQRCYPGPFVFDFTSFNERKLYHGIIKRFIQIFKERIEIIIN